MKTSSTKRKLEPQEQTSPPVPLESLEDIAWELWLLIELLAPVRRRLPNTASQKLVDYVKDRLIAKSVALAKWKKGRPELFPDSLIRARDVLPGENWTFPDHRTARFHVPREAISIVFSAPRIVKGTGRMFSRSRYQSTTHIKAAASTARSSNLGDVSQACQYERSSCKWASG